ncbi:VOC family protein [Bordetella petrii]|uniref:VOC family protein n=1 Tax=Bordetella petrii TaxID=94624 RepID=A0ABT7W7E8_9BORD|nr:VOC family protein [Bordetella petrii]MDM9561101.1 VOC family protein [Bordetella petrii]
MSGGQAITTFLWFDHQAEEAARFYTSVFKNSRLGDIVRYPAGTPGPEGSVMTVTFTLNGQEFVALNGGPHFSFTPAISLVINCQDQAEVDYYWERLSTGGPGEQCGWVQDKYGLSWQIVPVELTSMLKRADSAAAARIMKAVLGMRKLDLAAIRRAGQAA